MNKLIFEVLRDDRIVCFAFADVTGFLSRAREIIFFSAGEKVAKVIQAG